jgi:hypothetical protein
MSRTDKPAFKPSEINLIDSEAAKAIFSPYLTEKDKRAKERLKNHPIPKEFCRKTN